MKIALHVALVIWMIICLVAIVLPAIAEKPTMNSSYYPNVTNEGQNSTVPARIELRAEKAYVTADDADNVRITAFAFDAQGNPVADGYKINFTIGSITSNSFMGRGDFNYVPGAQGRLNSPDDSNNFYQGMTCDNSGSTSVQFGWIDELYSGNNSTIWVYYADNASVFASIKIYSAAPMASWTGYVVDSSGNGLGGINIKMHVMGMNGSTPYEIYNLTRTSESKPPYVGRFAFSYIVIQGVAYGYVDTEARLANNLTVYGKSDNFSMNWSHISIGDIVVNVPASGAANVTAMVSPSATARPTPGFEALLALAGSLGVAYLTLEKEN